MPAEFSSACRTMSMQMIGRRSISARSEFSCGPRRRGRRGLVPPPPPPPPPPLLTRPPATTPVDKRGPAPVDNGPMALRMQAQGSALFEFVAFCRCLSSARLSRPPPSVPYRVLPTRLFGLGAVLADALRNLRSPIRRPVPPAALLPLFIAASRATLSCDFSRVNRS